MMSEAVIAEFMEGGPQLSRKQFINQNHDDEFKEFSSGSLQLNYQTPPTKTTASTSTSPSHPTSTSNSNSTSTSTSTAGMETSTIPSVRVHRHLFSHRGIFSSSSTRRTLIYYQDDA